MKGNSLYFLKLIMFIYGSFMYVYYVYYLWLFMVY